MPVAKLMFKQTDGRLPAEPRQMAAVAVTDHRELTKQWSVAALNTSVGTPGDAWELAYEAVRENPNGFFEPDYPSGFHGADSRVVTRGAAGDSDFGIANDQVGTTIRGPGFGWHLTDSYSQLARAREDAEAGTPTPIRVAICDVGFDLGHSTFPSAHARMDLARNFLPDAAPHNVRDRNVQGLMQNPGHGTATIALLCAGELPAGILTAEPVPADRVLGAVPQAEVVPLRIATSVTLLDTSTFVSAINYLMELHAAGTHVDVVSMSMGGVASAAWAEVVNHAYERGILVVSAAGNNIPLIGSLYSPKSTVYPARFNRVISVTGVTAAFEPYATLSPRELKMRGNCGPQKKMRTSIAAFTPNAPWAELGNPLIVDLDGQGTSSATPQVAGAAALYLRKHKQAMAGWQPWQVVECARRALLHSAKPIADRDCNTKYVGAGVLRAYDALQVIPQIPDRPEAEDSVFLPAFEVLFGRWPFGLAAGANEENARRMLWLETVQLIHRDPNVESAVADPDSGTMTEEEQRKLAAAVLDSQHASYTLKKVFGSRYKPQVRTLSRKPIEPPPPAVEPEPPVPENRRLRTYAFDPSLSGSFDTCNFNQITLEVPWEQLNPGPTGEYVEVIDHDPAGGCYYPAVHLDDVNLLAIDGMAPSVGNPQFHQQMVYAVTMQTIRNFELALGRRVQWSPVMKEGSRDDSQFVGKLRIYPHALRERNAYYHPGKKALLFGYFPARPADPQELYSGGTTFTCLSHDIVAHETTHAILDGIYREFNVPTNPDQLAFHEAFADIVALLQHFAHSTVVESQIRRTRGDLSLDNALKEMAVEFGKATGMHAPLRTATGGGTDPKTGRPNYDALAQTLEIHDRGAILVGAVFDAFLAIYRARTADLKRIASGGTGELPVGDIHPDLVRRFAKEASTLASQFLLICIRALDYCPPVDLNFGDYLRALITADHDLVPNDPYGYRVALTESFLKRAIFPVHLGTYGEETLLWNRPETDRVEKFFSSSKVVLERFANRLREIDAGPGQKSIPKDGARNKLFDATREARRTLHKKLLAHIKTLGPEDRRELGQELGLDLDAADPKFEVHTLAIAERQGPDGRVIHQFVVTFVQRHKRGDIEAWSGSTVLLNRGGSARQKDPERRVRHIISKRPSEHRIDQSVSFAISQLAGGNPYLRVPKEQRFAMIHGTGGMIYE